MYYLIYADFKHPRGIEFNWRVRKTITEHPAYIFSELIKFRHRDFKFLTCFDMYILQHKSHCII